MNKDLSLFIYFFFFFLKKNLFIVSHLTIQKQTRLQHLREDSLNHPMFVAALQDSRN